MISNQKVLKNIIINFKLIVLILTILIIVILLSRIIKTNEKTLIKEKNNPFECGFDPSHKIRASFSLRFFVLTIIFLIFDVEVARILPIPLCNIISFTNMFIWNTSICLLLFLGIVFEWKQGALSWAWVSI